MHQNLKKKVWLFINIFLPLKESLTLFQIWIFFCYAIAYFISFGVIENRATKIILMENVTIPTLKLVSELYIL